MATKKYQVVEVTSDLSNEEGAETLQYSVQGTKYAIDLTEGEQAEFMEALAPYIAVSRIKGKPGNGQGGGNSRKEHAEEVAAIREWAQQNGYEVNPTGRIPNNVREAYEEAHPGKGKRKKTTAAA